MSRKRFCEPCEAVVQGRECPRCGADTTAIPKDVDVRQLEAETSPRTRGQETAKENER